MYIPRPRSVVHLNTVNVTIAFNQTSLPRSFADELRAQASNVTLDMADNVRIDRLRLYVPLVNKSSAWKSALVSEHLDSIANVFVRNFLVFPRLTLHKCEYRRSDNRQSVLT